MSTPLLCAGTAVGIIDIGSNTVRLSVVETLPGGAYRIRHEQKVNLRLGARIRADGCLGPEAAEETARVVADFVASGADWAVGTWLAVGTAAVRQAVDGPALLRTVTERTGLTVRLLPGEEEARLGLVGALNTLGEPEGYAVDIGGASTELTRFVARRVAESLSLPLGAVNASARFGMLDRAPASSVQALRQELEERATATGWLRQQPGGVLIGIGGTVRALSKLDRKRRGYPLHGVHNYMLDPTEAVRLAERLAAMTARERQRLPGMAAERADLIAAGACLLAWAIERTRPSRVVVSGSGLREGLFFNHLLADQPEPLFPDVLEASVANIETCYTLPAQRAARLGALAAALWEHLGPLAGAPAPLARLLPAAARLREVGTAISYYDWEQHTFYVLREARLYGVDHRERLLLAAAAAYNGAGRVREQLQPYDAILQPGDDRLAVRLGIAAALAHALDRACHGRALPLQVSTLSSAVRIATGAPPASGFTPGALGEDFRKWFGRALGVVPGEATL